LAALTAARLFAQQPAAQIGTLPPPAPARPAESQPIIDLAMRDVSDSLLPPEPEPAEERPNTPWAVKEHVEAFDRVGIGADISPLGIGIKSATILTQYLDARLMGNFFGYNTGQFELEGFRVNANLHLASAGAALDWYPLDSVIRLSVGTLFFNGNRFSFKGDVQPGTSFALDSTQFYSANANPVTGSGVIGLHRHRPGLTLSGGFGKFVPRSNRHWSFPAEFGVLLMGAPTLDLQTTGSVCLDQAQTQCGNLSDTANPVTVQYNNALQTSLTKWRKSLSAVQVYPLFSYSVVYSFNIR
jgi:hypothetical protein